MSEIGVKKFTDMQRVMRLFKSETKLLFQILFVIFMLISTAGAGYFNGTVYNDMGKFEPDVTIEIYAQGKTVPLYSTKTDPKGFFKFDSIVDDRYQIRIIPKHHPAQWYSTGENTLFPQNYIWIGSVTVPITLMKDPIDNSPASIVKVSVYDESGTPVGDICCINLIQSWDNAWVVGTNLDSNSIVFSGLHPSQYALFMNFPPYPSQYYNATGNSVQKSNFTVSGSDTTFIRFYLTMYPKGTGYISGRCITDKGVPAAGVSLSLFKVNDTTIPVYSQITLTDGTFGFNYILPENYYLKISGNDFPVQWYSRARAQTVTFPEDPVKTSPDPKLDSLYIAVTMSPLVNDSRAVVSLKVMDSTGTLIKDSGVVQLIEASSQIRKNLTFDPVAQHYKADMVAAGNYSLFLNIPGYNPQYYAPTGNTLFESHKFFVNPEDTLSLRTNLIGQKIDTMLSKSMITGIVSDSGKPYKGANLKLFDNKGVLQNQAISDSSGIFTLNVSTGGAYYLVIEAPGYPLQFWTGKGSTLQIGIDDYFTVASGITFKADISLIRNNIVKTDSSMISGIITDKITGKPVPFLRVILIPSSLIFSGMDVPFLSSEYITQTDISGSFKFTGIPLNTYWLAVYTDSSGYISQFYPGFDSINNATRIILSSSTSKVTANMAVLPGGIIRGVVQNNVGQPVSDVHVNVLLQNSSHGYSSKTDSNGVFQVKGLRTGTYKLEIYSKEYILRESIQKEYQVTEGMTTDINSIVMVEGGYVSGTYYYSGSPDITAGSYLNGAEIAMVPDTSRGGPLYWFDLSVYAALKPFAVNNPSSGSFNSSLCKTGKYILVFKPGPLSKTSGVSDTFSIKPNFGWSFITTDTSISGPQVVQISPRDTLKNVFAKIRAGYSVCGTITFNGLPVNNSNYEVSAFVKIDTSYFLVSNALRLSGSRFELPGLVKNEDYYIQVWGEGFQRQFWSPEGNSLYPKYAYTFDSLKQLSISISDTIKDENIQNLPSPINLSVSASALSRVVLKWDYDPSISIDTFKVFKMDRYDKVSVAARIPVKSGVRTYDYNEDNNLPDIRFNYIVTGKGKNTIVRSNQCMFDSRSLSMAPNQTWLDVFVKNRSIVLEWGAGDSIRFGEKDSIVVYRKKGSEIWNLHTKRSAFERLVFDYDWTKDDSGKVFQYKIELPNGISQTDIQSITIDTSLILFRPEIVVGPYEKYKTIQEAIDFAGEFDRIRVRTGTYRENLNFKGKNLIISGEWEYGKPPVIDGGGAIAFSVPIARNFRNFYSKIDGFKITNASIGILAKCNLSVNRCLFSNVAKSIETSLDSSEIAKVITANPFVDSKAHIYVSNTTFIASGTGNYVASSIMAGAAENTSATQTTPYESRYYIYPLFSWGTTVDIHNSSFSYYYTRAKLSELPLKFSGKSSKIVLKNCNIWQTSISVSANIRIEGELQSIDPQYTDTTWFFTPDNSPLKKLNIGYDSDFRQEKPIQGPATIKNLQVKILGLSSIALKWDPSPAPDKVKYYMIYRAPGDTSFYYVNQDSTWNIKSSRGLADSIVKTFSTSNAYFIDTTVFPGKPYLYVVTAVDSTGNEGRIIIPPYISDYFVNTYQYQYKVKGGLWVMVGPWGTRPVSVAANQNVILYNWNDKAESTKLLSQYNTTTEMIPGNGYWLKSTNDTVLKISNVIFDSLKNVKNVNLVKGSSGWNQFSSPFPFEVSPPWLSSIATWEWNPDSMGYTRAYSLKPWNAYWINVSKDTALPYIDTANWMKNSSTLAKQMNQSLWELSVSLKGKAAWDPENKIGVIRGGINKTGNMLVQEPPEAFGASQLYFIQHDESDGNIQKLSYLYKNSEAGSGGKMEWTVCITASDQPATVYIHDVKTLPKGIFVFWVNENGIQDLSINDQIQILPHTDNVYGYIVATSNIKDVELYKNIYLLHGPYPNPFRERAAIQFSVPYSWLPDGTRSTSDYRNVELVIYDLAGRKIKTLLNGSVKVGTHSVYWDGDNDFNGQVATGLYLIRMRCDNFVKTNRLCRIR